MEDITQQLQLNIFYFNAINFLNEKNRAENPRQRWQGDEGHYFPFLSGNIFVGAAFHFIRVFLVPRQAAFYSYDAGSRIIMTIHQK